MRERERESRKNTKGEETRGEREREGDREERRDRGERKEIVIVRKREKEGGNVCDCDKGRKRREKKKGEVL